MLALAAGSNPALAPAIIAAASSVVSALLLAWVALRAQSAREQLEAIRRIVEEELHDQLDAKTRGLIISEWIKRALREVLGEDPRNRRWYDHNDP